MKKRTVTIQTAAFKLVVYWNGVIMSAQACVVFSCISLLLFSRTESVKNLCTVLLLADLIAVVILLLREGSIDIGESEAEDKRPAPKSTPKSSHDVSNEGNKNTGSSVKETNGVIKNKVASASTPGVNRGGSNTTPAPQQNTESKKVESAPTQAPTPQEAAAKATSTNNMTQEDWNDIFNW